MGKLAEIAPLQGFLEIGAAVPGPALARRAHQLDPGFENLDLSGLPDGDQFRSEQGHLFSI